MCNKKYPLPFFKKAQYFIPNQWDLFALALLFGLLGWLAWGGAHMVTPYELGQRLPLTLEPKRLPAYAGLSVLRMVVALIVSFIFTLTVGSLAAKSARAARLIIPCIDVLQSVPVLGFLSLTVTGFIRLFSGSRLGPECAAIFAIFTAQVWNMTLSFYQSLRSVPPDLTEAATLFQLSAWQRFWRLEVPFALPGLLWNMMLSMSGSWVFLVASESIAVANHTIHLPGIGSYLGLAISRGSLPDVAWAVLAMLIVILIYDQLSFRPLIAWSYKFRVQESITEAIPRAWLITLLQHTHVLQRVHTIARQINPPLLHLSFFNKKIFQTPKRYLPTSIRCNPFLLKMTCTLLGLYGMKILIRYAVKHIDWAEGVHALVLGGATALRVTTVVFISSIIWVPVGVWVGLRPRLRVVIQPIVQFLAAFPANVLFPLMVIMLLKFKLHFEFGVLPLMLLGSQWYILVNVIAGVGAIPKELYHMTQNLGLNQWLWWKKLILPGIFPSLIIGIMTAVGAAWNVSVIAEVIQWGGSTLKVVGLGAYIEEASMHGDTVKVAIGIAAMSLWVLTLNYLIWQPLYRLAQSKYRLD